MAQDQSAAQLKRIAAEAALEHVRPGMVLGLGSGSTAEIFVGLLGAKAAELDLRCAATSERTAGLARDAGLDVRELNEFTAIDLCIDGADEIDPALNLIKGGGACHLREKVVARFSRRFIVIADESKLVQQLGAFRIPLEVIPFALPLVRREVELLGGSSSLRQSGGADVLTDEGNLVLDADFGLIEEPQKLSQQLNAIPGIVEHGLFINMACEALIGTQSGLLIQRSQL